MNWRFRRWWGMAILLAALPASATQTTPVISLGEAGLTLDLQLWLQPAATPGAPVGQSTAGLTVVDLTTGSYVIAGLPDATGMDRLSLEVYGPADPDRPLYVFQYGAHPGQSIVYQATAILTVGMTLVEDDTASQVQLVVASGLPEAVGSGAAILRVSKATTGTAVITAGPLVISNVVYVASGPGAGTWGATFTGPAVIADFGEYDLEVRLTYAGPCTGGSCVQTLPQEGPRRVRVRRRL